MNKYIEELLLTGLGVWAGRKVWQHLKRQSSFKDLTISDQSETRRPTLLLHGTNGTKRSLGGMIERWEKSGIAYKALDIEVSPYGELKVTGDWREQQKKHHPLIQVWFKEGDPPEWQQGEWVKRILEKLKTDLAIDEVNILGHSCGGIAGLRYLADYGRYTTLPKVKKFVTIGAPFNGEVTENSGRTFYDLGRTGPVNEFSTYRYFKTYWQNIPKELKVLNIYGDLKNGSRSDGVVASDSVKSLRFLLSEHVALYREKQLFGVKAQHSLLHENKQVDHLAAEFLWTRREKGQ